MRKRALILNSHMCDIEDTNCAITLSDFIISEIKNWINCVKLDMQIWDEIFSGPDMKRARYKWSKDGSTAVVTNNY